MHFTSLRQTQYKISSALDENMVLDCVADGDNPLVLWKWHQGANQKWYIISHGKNMHSFFNVLNSKIMSSPINSQKDGIEVKCKISKKKQQQIWMLIPCFQAQFKEKNAFFIKSSSGKLLDVCQGKAKNGQKIIQWEQKKLQKLKEKLNQIWIIDAVSFIPEKNTNYKIFSALDYGLVWDASKHPTTTNDIVLCLPHKCQNQKFGIINWKGKYLIVNKQNNFSVQVDQGSSGNQAKIKAANSHRANHELWQIIPCNNKQYQNKSAFYIRSCYGKYLDISNGQATNGASVIQSDYHGNKNQIWFIVKI